MPGQPGVDGQEHADQLLSASIRHLPCLDERTLMGKMVSGGLWKNVSLEKQLCFLLLAL